MSGPSFDASQIPALIVDTGVGVIADTYDRGQLGYEAFTEVVDVMATTHPPMGDKSTTIIGGMEPVERLDGEPISAGTMGQGYVPQGAIKVFSRSLSIPERQIMAAGANPKNFIGSIIGQAGQDFSRQAINAKNRRIAKMMAYGAKTAGDIIYDGSFVGNADTYPLLGYDGVCWLAGAHPLKFGTTTYDNHLEGTALSSANLSTAYDTMSVTNAVDENGKRIFIRPSRLVVPGSLRVTAQQVLQTSLEVGTANNTINTNNGIVDLTVWNYLDEFDTNGWFLLADTPTIRVMDSGAPSIRTHFDEETRSQVVTFEYWFGAYLRDWRGILGANLATS